MSEMPHPPSTTSAARHLTCQQVTDTIVDYITAAMDEPSRQVFASHLSQCPDCQAFLATYQETIRNTHAVRYEAIPGEMLSRVEQFLRTHIASQDSVSPNGA
jgi:anti-sigma factor RsiW